jgi:hypothetical protein
MFHFISPCFVPSFSLGERSSLSIVGWPPRRMPAGIANKKDSLHNDAITKIGYRACGRFDVFERSDLKLTHWRPIHRRPKGPGEDG